MPEPTTPAITASRTSAQAVILALAPPAPGLSSAAPTPGLELLGGSRLVERLRRTLDGVLSAPPVVVTTPSARGPMRTLLGPEVRVLEATDRSEALSAALDATDHASLLLHDAERALTPSSVIVEVLGIGLQETDLVVPVVAMTDSIKGVSPAGLRNIDRSGVVGLQSPRLIRREILEQVLAAERTAPPRENTPAVGARAFDEVLGALSLGARVRTVHGSHAGFAVVDRLSLWQAQISLGLARDTSHRHGLARGA